jgi:hypothetical protein
VIKDKSHCWWPFPSLLLILKVELSIEFINIGIVAASDQNSIINDCLLFGHTIFLICMDKAEVKFINQTFIVQTNLVFLLRQILQHHIFVLLLNMSYFPLEQALIVMAHAEDPLIVLC